MYIFTSRWLLLQHGVWLNIVYPLFAVSVNYTALTLYDYFTEERERKKIKDTFRHYVSPVVVEEMIKDPSSFNPESLLIPPSGHTPLRVPVPSGLALP